MSTGAQRVDAQPDDGVGGARSADWLGIAQDNDSGESGEATPFEPDETAAPRSGLAAILLVLAAAWTGASLWVIWSGNRDLAGILSGIAVASGPLILLGFAWIIFGRTQRRETERFTAAVGAMRRESAALESVLAIVANRLEDNHARLTGEAAKLMSLGDEASDRLGRVTHYISRETANLDKRAEALEAAAANARVDIGVLLSDLPRAEAQARSMSDAMKEAGLSAHAQAGALEGQLSALIARGREADEAASGAAQRLAAHLGRIESMTESASTRMDEASAGMTAAVDASMTRAAEAVDAARSGLEAQGAAMLAMVEQSRAALEHAGEDAARNLAGMFEAIGGKVQDLAAHLSAHDAASQALVTGLTSELAELDTRFAALAETGGASTAQLGDAVGAVRASVSDLAGALDGGQERAAELIGRTREMAHALGEVAGQLNHEVPGALARIEEQAGRTREAAAGLVPQVEAVKAAAGDAAARLSEAEASVAWQREQLERGNRELVAGLTEQLGALEERFSALREVGGASADRLGDAFVRVRDAVAGFAEALEAGDSRSGSLIARARDMDTMVAGITARLADDVPVALSRADERIAATRAAAAALTPELEAVQTLAGDTAGRLADAEASIARQRDALDATGRDLVGGLLAQVREAESGFESLRVSGGSSVEQLRDSVAGIDTAVADLSRALDTGDERSNAIAERAREMAAALGGAAERLSEMPDALQRVEERAERARDAADGLAPRIEAIESLADRAASRLGDGEASVARQHEAVEALLARLSEGVTAAQAQLDALSATVEEAEAAGGRIATQTAPELVEALVRVRETANQAAVHARDAIAAVIPQSAAALGEAGRQALAQAVDRTVGAQMAEVGAAAERAVDAARNASERLTRQLLTIGETAAAIEARIDEARREREEKEAEGLSRRVALLIESLNSTAIDVTKILSNEVTDSAWNAYLKGDRGVFTRRAVRLLDTTEAREILVHYENEPEFREQVNRYIHDFEGMLRRVLADRDGSPLGVTILSSDMGKLYVALAQAIERLRK